VARKRLDVEVPDGQHLGWSRDTDGAYRAHLFDDETGNLVGHAELFEPEEDYEFTYEPPYDYSPLEDSERVSSARMSEQERDEALEALGALIAIGIYAAVEFTPHIKRWWRSKALPAVEATWEKIRPERLVSRRPDKCEVQQEPTVVVSPSPERNSIELRAAYEDFRADMSSEEARQRLVAALLAKSFHEEQMRMLSSARIYGEFSTEVANVIKRTKPEQVADAVNMMLERQPSMTHPENLQVLNEVLQNGRKEGVLAPLRNKHVKKVLRLTAKDSATD
jgi:hypothetical protein